jgi:hypothetical protein
MITQYGRVLERRMYDPASRGAVKLESGVYVAMREDALKRYGLNRFVGFWVPRIAYLESMILFHFASEGKKLYWIRKYRCNGKVFSVYKVGCSHVFLESFGKKDICEIRVSKDVDRWFRLALIRSVLSGRESVRRVLNMGVGREWIFDVSLMWQQYYLSKSRRDFVEWARSHAKFFKVQRLRLHTNIGRRLSKNS